MEHRKQPRSDLYRPVQQSDLAQNWKAMGAAAPGPSSGDTVLLGHEYRTCIKLNIAQLDDPAEAIAEAYQRLCVDLRDLPLIGKFDYVRSRQASDCGSGSTTCQGPPRRRPPDVAEEGCLIGQAASAALGVRC